MLYTEAAAFIKVWFCQNPNQ